MHYGYRIVEDMIDGLAELPRGARASALAGRPRGQARCRRSATGASWTSTTSRGPHRRREVHPLQPVLHRLRGRRAPGDRPRSARTATCDARRSTTTSASAATSASSSARSTAASRWRRSRRRSRSGRGGGAARRAGALRRRIRTRVAAPGPSGSAETFRVSSWAKYRSAAAASSKIDDLDPLVGSTVRPAQLARAIGEREIDRDPVELVEQARRHLLLARSHSPQNLDANGRDAQQPRVARDALPRGHGGRRVHP